MNGDDRIQAAMSALARETAHGEASPRVRARLLKEIRRRRIRQAAPWWLTAAAALLAGVVLGLWPGARPQSEQVASTPLSPAVEVQQAPRAAPEGTPAISPQPAVAARRAASPPGRGAVRPASNASVIATPWMVHQALSPVQRGQVLRLPMTAELARQFGVPQQSGEWQAEIFVGDDGLARAFRLVRVPAYK